MSTLKNSSISSSLKPGLISLEGGFLEGGFLEGDRA
jgi:hypothetical protein